MIRAPLALARFKAIHWTGSATDGLRPTIRAQRVSSMSSPPVTFRPVILSATARHPPHRSWFIIQFGEPMDRISRAIISPRLKKAPLVTPVIEAGPYRRRTSANRSAISEMASSQLIGSNVPAPRAFVRRNGVFKRPSLYVHSFAPRIPLTQNAPLEPGCAVLGAIFATMPFSTVSNDPQMVPHSQQVLGLTELVGGSDD